MIVGMSLGSSILRSGDSSSFLSIHEMQVSVASGCERRGAAEGALVRRPQLYFCSDAAFFRCSRLVALAFW